HFNYTYPPRSAVFEPAWDGTGTLTASRIPAERILNRAKNSAREVDAKVEELLRSYRAHRGGEPLLIVTGDHGEEFNETGRLGHSSDVSVQQIHVPMILKDETVAAGRVGAPTGHVDLLPTLFTLLGDGHDPALYSDGEPMQRASPDRYVLAMEAWARKFALVGREMKVTFHEGGASPKGVRVTDPFDRPLPDGEARFAAEAPRLLRRLRGQVQVRQEKVPEALAGSRD
ncbi:MAG TPA: sulfatase-like hydrolase/transferase, partial [Vulgatibacter sp.]